MSTTADEGVFVFDSPMAGYRAKLTPERPTENSCKRRVWPISGGQPGMSVWPLDFGNGRSFRGEPNAGIGGVNSRRKEGWSTSGQ
jgi:hypothetical protein